MSAPETMQPQLSKLSDKLRNNATFIRAGAFSPEDAGWFSDALDGMAVEAAKLEELTNVR